MLTLFRRGRIGSESLDRQLDAIHDEETALKREVHDLRSRLRAAEESNDQVNSADALLRTLNERLDETLDWETRRELIQTLVERITIQTVDADGRRAVNVVARYRFTLVAIDNCTGTRADNNCYLEQVHEITQFDRPAALRVIPFRRESFGYQP
ncbi:MAG TPA: hypothetical protein VF746_30985 [Longimicrobium sp.]